MSQCDHPLDACENGRCWFCGWTYDDRLDPAFGHWLAGFIDGEGHFQIAKNTQKTGYTCRFGLTVRADDERILTTIRDTLGFGTVYRYLPRQDVHPATRWQVQSLRDCLALVEILRRYPMRAKKVRDFGIWAEAVEVWRVGQDNRAYARERMGELKEFLEATRRFENSDVVHITTVAPPLPMALFEEV